MFHHLSYFYRAINLHNLLFSDRCIRYKPTIMSWHQPNPSIGRSPDSTSCHAPGFDLTGFWPRPLPPAQPALATCRLCPEPGLVPASLMSDHLRRGHTDLTFECAACKVSFPLRPYFIFLIIARVKFRSFSELYYGHL